MALRGSKVGQPVRFREFAGKPLVEGTIVAIDGSGVRSVATDKGVVFRAPEELEASDADPNVKPVEELAVGDVVVLFNGMRRTVASVVPIGTPPRWRVTFAENDKALSIFREQTSKPGDLWRVVPESVGGTE